MVARAGKPAMKTTFRRNRAGTPTVSVSNLSHHDRALPQASITDDDHITMPSIHRVCMSERFRMDG